MVMVRQMEAAREMEIRREIETKEIHGTPDASVMFT
jgi:hypothetical protein